MNKRWEYKVTDSDYAEPQPDIVEKMNNEGWEMYSAIRVYDYDDDVYMFYWKRQVITE